MTRHSKHKWLRSNSVTAWGQWKQQTPCHLFTLRYNILKNNFFYFFFYKLLLLQGTEENFARIKRMLWLSSPWDNEKKIGTPLYSYFSAYYKNVEWLLRWPSIVWNLEAILGICLNSYIVDREFLMRINYVVVDSREHKS